MQALCCKEPHHFRNMLFSTHPVNSLHPSSVLWVLAGCSAASSTKPRGRLPRVPGTQRCPRNCCPVSCRPAGKVTEKLSRSGSKAGEYVGKLVLSASLGSRRLLPASRQDVNNDIMGGVLTWGSVAEMWTRGGQILGLNAGCSVLLEESAEMPPLHVPESQRWRLRR